MSKEIKITTAESHSPLDGKSKWWGAPDMPEDMPYPYVMVLGDDNEQYPEPLTFICQIRLEDIADYAVFLCRYRPFLADGVAT